MAGASLPDLDLFGEMDGNRFNQVAYVAFLLLGLGLTAWVFSGQDFAALWAVLVRTRWAYVALSLLLTLLGHWVRAARWQQLVEEGGEGRSGTTLPYMVSLMNGYLVNLGVPRLGELTRCLSLNRLAGVAVLRAGATVVVERLVDLACLLLVLLGTFWVMGPEMSDFFAERIFAPLRDKAGGGLAVLLWLGLGCALGLAALWLAFRFWPDNRLLRFLQGQGRELKAGLLGLLRLKRKGLFVGATLLIWASYCSAPILTLYALDLGGDRLLEIGFVAFAVGSIARTIPAPAGSMGAYHWLVTQALVLYAFSDGEGLAVATLNHAVQTAFYLFFGGISFLVWPFLGRRYN